MYFVEPGWRDCIVPGRKLWTLELTKFLLEIMAETFEKYNQGRFSLRQEFALVS